MPPGPPTHKPAPAPPGEPFVDRVKKIVLEAKENVFILETVIDGKSNMKHWTLKDVKGFIEMREKFGREGTRYRAWVKKYSDYPDGSLF